MARKSYPLTKNQDLPSLSSDQAVQLLRKQCEKAKQMLDKKPITSSAMKTWETVTREVLSRAFGASSPNVTSVMSEGQFELSYISTERELEEKYAEITRTRLEMIDGLIELLMSNSTLEKNSSLQSVSRENESIELSNHVFLVHGQKEAAIHETARFLERLDLKVTILREQPNSGRTIIEKFIDFSDVAFAVVLLTGDDRGGKFDGNDEEQRLRARQNVILELGFFLGKLGRERVCALYQDGVDIPSDYRGVLFIPSKQGKDTLTI